MVLSGVNLPNCAAHPGPILTYDYEQVFSNKPHLLIGLDYLDVSEALPVGTHFVLPLHYDHAAFPKDAEGFLSSPFVEVENRVVILLLCVVARPVVPVMLFKGWLAGWLV